MATGADAAEASWRHGEQLIEAHVTWLGRKGNELLADYRPPDTLAARVPGNPLGALTFEQAERLWRDEVEPIVPELVSMNVPSDRGPVDPGSPWAPNEISRLF